MRRKLHTIFLSLLVLAIASCQAIASLTPQATPSLSTADEEIGKQGAAMVADYVDEIDPLDELPRYDIHLQVDFDRAQFSGNVTLSYRNQENRALDRLYFRLFPNGGKSFGDGELVVDEVTVDGEASETNLSMNDTVLEVVLPEPLNVGRQLPIRFEFRGRVPGTLEGLGYGIFNKKDQVMALANAYPLLAVYDEEGWNLDPVSAIGDSVYSDSAYYHVLIDVSQGLTVVATGSELNRQQIDDDRQRIEYVTGPVRDFFLIISPEYQRSSRKIRDTKVNAYYLPGHKGGGRHALEVASQSLEVFNQRFGLYPYQELDVVEAPMQYASGVEYPSVVLVRSELYERSPSTTFSVVLAHEVAHQWWYGVVGSDVIDEPWLDEALTTYSSSLYFEHVGGPQSYQQMISYFQRTYRQAKERDLDDFVTEDLGHFESSPAGRQAYSPIVYSKGALFFKALRDQMGDEAFFDALREYYSLNQFGIGEPEELLSIFEKHAPQPVDELYHRWLYSKE